jgi:hypothetical protein
VGDHTKTVCSTVIAEAFQNVSFPILPVIQTSAEKGYELIPRNPRLITPRDFDYSPYFEIIKYPFIQVVEQGMYRSLPWNETGLTSNTGTIFDPQQKNNLAQQSKKPILPPIFADPPDVPINSHQFSQEAVMDAILTPKPSPSSSAPTNKST